MVHLPDTPTNRERVTTLLEQAIRQNNPSAGLVKREKPDRGVCARFLCVLNLSAFSVFSLRFRIQRQNLPKLEVDPVQPHVGRVARGHAVNARHELVVILPLLLPGIRSHRGYDPPSTSPVSSAR